ncbi:alpha/beta hydrolase [Streptomyces sp. INA 01156]
MRRLAARPAGDRTYARAVSEVRGGLYTVHPGWTGVADLLEALWSGWPLLAPGVPTGVPVPYPGFEQPLAVMCAESPTRGHHCATPSWNGGRWRRPGSWPTGGCGPTSRAPPGQPGGRPVHRPVGPGDRPPGAGGEHDPRPLHPYRAAQNMVGELGDARLLTLDGYGHTALDNPSACVGRHVVRYFLTGALPPKGARCTQDLPPFAPPAEAPSASASEPMRAQAGTPAGGLPRAASPDGPLPSPYGAWPLEVVEGLLPPRT